MKLRSGNAGSNTFTGHKVVLSDALKRVPSRFRRKIMVRVDGAGASHDLVKHLLSLSSKRKTVLFTTGWMITEADEDAIRRVPAAAWKPGTAQDGTAEEDKEVAEITGLMTRAENWPDGLRWICRRVKPSRRQMRNLTAYEKETGWRYSIICTNIPDSGIAGVPGSHHPQYIDVLHREHAIVETAGVRTAKAMGTSVPHLPAPAPRPSGTDLTSTNNLGNTEGDHPGAVGAGAHPGTPGTPRTPQPKPTDINIKNGSRHNQ